jgi:DNA-binding MarR family transcriptional regulator
VRTHSADAVSRENVGFLLAKALQRWNELLGVAFAREGFPEVRPAYGSILLSLQEEDGLQIVELARRAGLSKQTLTTQLKALEERGLVVREPDATDRRATRIYLTERGREFRPVAALILHELDTALAAALSQEEIALLSAALRTIARLDLDAAQIGMDDAP